MLAERPFRDLRSRASLGVVAGRLGAAQPPLLAMRVPNPVPGFVPAELDPDLAALGVAKVVIAGPYQQRGALEHALAVAARARARGLMVGTCALSLERAAAQRQAPAGIAVLDAADPLEVRDFHTANTLMVWRVAVPPAIVAYPEREAAADAGFPVALPDAPLLGLAIAGTAESRQALARHAAPLRARLADLHGWPVLPLPVEMPGDSLDDLPGARAFRDAVLPDSPLLLPGLAETAFRRRHLTVARLRGLVARCAVVVTNQDLVAAFAVAAGVPVRGIVMGQERRAATCLATLANELPAGSDLIYPERYEPSPRDNSSARA